MEAAKQIESIRQLYTSREGRLAPFSWCEHFYFHLDDIFTRLVMVSKEKEVRGTGARRNLEFTEIFQAHKECEEPKKVLIEGKPVWERQRTAISLFTTGPQRKTNQEAVSRIFS